MKTDETMDLISIGRIRKEGDSRRLRVDSDYRAALAGLDRFGHLIVLWWADRYQQYRTALEPVIELPYAPGTEAGYFATRSPVRPNPIGLNTCAIVSVDVEAGIVDVDEIDAFDGTQIIDIKPYYGCIDRVKEYRQPEWVPEEWGVWHVPIPEMDYVGDPE